MLEHERTIHWIIMAVLWSMLIIPIIWKGQTDNEE